MSVYEHLLLSTIDSIGDIKDNKKLLHGVVVLQVADTVIIIFKNIPQNLVRMLAQQGWWDPDTGFRLRILHRGSRQFNLSCLGMVNLLNHVASDHLWVLECLRD